MKSKLFSKRMTRGIVCGLVGVLVLSVSAFAAYGSTSGYGKYKDALTKLVLDTDNVTMKLSAGVSYDGDTPFKTAMVYKYDGKNFSRHEKTVSSIDDNSGDWYYSVIDGTATQFWADNNTYDQYPYEGETSFFDMGEYSDKMVKFLSVFADTVVGDLKNNVVLVNDEDGIRSYSMDVTADQVPALISAGLDDQLVILHTHNSADDAADGGDPVAVFHGGTHLLGFLLPLVLGTDEHEIEDSQHQNQSQKHAGHTGSTGVGQNSKHLGKLLYY